MIDYADLLAALAPTPLRSWLTTLPQQLRAALQPSSHGGLGQWKRVLTQLPVIQPSAVELDTPCITIGNSNDCDETQHRLLESLLHQLHPWRKGPYTLFGIHIDTEWRSDLKWDRLKDHIQPLQGRTVLDAGCGSGYHCWRMRGAGAALVIGVDPTLVYSMQFHAIRHYVRGEPVYVLPLGIEALPPGTQAFDTVFSMGLLYHRRDPLAHLAELRGCLRGGGELVLETLVYEGKRGGTLVPKGRYAKMRNVHAIPTCDTVETWLQASGFHDIRLIDVSKTTPQEQRATPWMTFESLADFLDPDDPQKTIEGYQAPRRAIILASKA